MKTALLHYWLIRMRGGENVMAEFCRLFPEADIFTHSYAPEKVLPLFGQHKVTESFIGRLPLARRNCQMYLPLMPYALRQWDLSGYELLLSSESGPVKGVRKPASAKHICYCHTPMRYLWDMYDEYFRTAGLCGKAAMALFRDRLRKEDLRSAECVDHFIANSHFVADRIRRIYHRDAEVIHPPADTAFFAARPEEKKEDFYLFAGALVHYKRADLAVEACRKLKRKLVIVGTGGAESYLRKTAPEDLVTFAGTPPKEELRRLYSSARALLFPGIEDFGIVPVEAQSCGTPVIAFGAGGALETVVNEETGLFFEESGPDSLAEAILRFEKCSFSPERCRANALKFTPERFREQMRNSIRSITGCSTL